MQHIALLCILYILAGSSPGYTAWTIKCWEKIITKLSVIYNHCIIFDPIPLQQSAFLLGYQNHSAQLTLGQFLKTTFYQVNLALQWSHFKQFLKSKYVSNFPHTSIIKGVWRKIPAWWGGFLSGGWFWSPGAWFGGAFLDGGWTVKSRDNPSL